MFYFPSGSVPFLVCEWLSGCRCKAKHLKIGNVSSFQVISGLLGTFICFLIPHGPPTPNPANPIRPEPSVPTATKLVTVGLTVGLYRAHQSSACVYMRFVSSYHPPGFFGLLVCSVAFEPQASPCLNSRFLATPHDFISRFLRAFSTLGH